MRNDTVSAAAEGLPESDCIDLKHIDDAMLAIRRKLLVINALIKSALGFAEDLGARDRMIQSEHHALVLIYELEQRIDNALAFADEADARLLGVAS